MLKYQLTILIHNEIQKLFCWQEPRQGEENIMQENSPYNVKCLINY